MKRTLSALALVLLAAGPASAAKRVEPPADPRPVFVQLADEVTAKMLENPAYRVKVDAGRKPRIVIGAVVNNTDDEGVRVDDIFAEIRNAVVTSGTAYLFAPGELDVDLIISPELTSSWTVKDRGRRQYCYVLQLTLTTVSGQYFAGHSATRCP